MRRATFAFVSVVVLVSATWAQQDWCDLVPPANEKKVVYCESLPLGTTQDGSYAVSLESKFFEGLRRTTAKGRARFQKDGRDVSAFPESFLVAVDYGSLVLPSGSVRSDKPKQPRKVRLRWLNSSGATMREVTADLEEVQEAWRELRNPKLWYRGKIVGVAEPLSSELEVTLIGDNGEVLGQVRRLL